MIALLAALAPMAAAQRVWVVDQANGPGTDFVDLPAAVAASAPGDLVLVRVGLYRPPTIRRGLSIVAHELATFAASTTPLTVEGVPAGEQVVIKGFLVLNVNLGQMVVRNNQGRVLLDRINTSLPSGRGSTLSVTDCAQVQVNSCVFSGGTFNPGAGPALSVVRATVALSDCSLSGAEAWIGHGTVLNTPALSASFATVTVSRGTLRGGNGAAWISLLVDDLPAIEANQSQIILCGDAATAITAGAAIPVHPVPGIQIIGGSLTKDPAIGVRGNTATAPPILGTGTVTTKWLPSLSARGTRPGGSLTASLFSPPGDVALFLTGMPAVAVDVPPIGALWLDPNLSFVVAVGVTDASGRAAATVPLPMDPQLSFGAWALQSLSGTPAGGFKLSNPVGCALVD